MKKLILLSVVVLASVQSIASTITYECSNIGAHITLSAMGRSLKIHTSDYPTETFVELTPNDVTVKSDVITDTPEVKEGCSTSKKQLVRITISKKDGSAMPNAYNQRAVNGVLSDLFICEESKSWLCH
ncbi:MAG: hypothetical protein H7061_10480 [Bdellovibrionaceae bacterium]|nr:hypothetical protein [Bdellovibrio sp.]